MKPQIKPLDKRLRNFLVEEHIALKGAGRVGYPERAQRLYAAPNSKSCPAPLLHSAVSEFDLL